MSKKIRVGLIGLGTIGSGVLEILKNRKSYINKKTSLDIEVVSVCDKDPKKIKAAGRVCKAYSNPSRIISDPSIDIVVELIGGIKTAKDIIVGSIKQGKHVVTANKALIADSGEYLFKLADKHKVKINFEASVCAGLPIIKSISETFVANRIKNIYGIINGTSNFILSNMEEKSQDFNEALKEAQKKGYAEADPSLDINGTDSAHKLAILSFLSFGQFFDMKDIYVEGIGDISKQDIEYAKELNYRIKLLAIAKQGENGVELRIHPTLVKIKHPLCNARGIYNAIYIKTDLADEILLHGKGAGKYPTASAVISDIVDIAKNKDSSSTLRYSDSFCFAERKNKIMPMANLKTRYYARFAAIDKPGVLAKISGILAKNSISIANVTQKQRNESKTVPIVMMTHIAYEGNMQRALREINKLEAIKSKSVCIRVEDL